MDRSLPLSRQLQVVPMHLQQYPPQSPKPGLQTTALGVHVFVRSFHVVPVGQHMPLLQLSPMGQVPQLIVPPQPSDMVPHCRPPPHCVAGWQEQSVATTVSGGETADVPPQSCAMTLYEMEVPGTGA